MKARITAILLFVLLAGCETVEQAQMLQDQLAVRGIDPARETLSTNAPARVTYVGERLPDFVAFALTNRPSVRVAELAVTNAALSLFKVWSAGPFMPQVSASGGYKRSTQNSGRHFGGHTDGDPYGEMSVDILICDWGRTEAQEQSAREALLEAQKNLRETKFNVFEEVAYTYFTLKQNDALLDAARTNELVYAEHVEEAELRYQNQEVKKLDVLKARLDLAEAQHKTVSASNDVIVAEANLLSALGLSSVNAVREEILPVDAQTLAATMCELEASDFDVEESVVRARVGSPVLMAARARVRAASAEVDYAIADFFPEISMGTTLSFADRVWNWSWMGSAVQSIFTGWRKTAVLEQAVVALESAEAELEVNEKQLAYELRQGLATRDNAKSSLAAAIVEVARARENLDAARAQYGEGDVSRTDFSDAVSDYTEALGNRIKAFYEGQMAEATLMRLTGASPIYVETRVSTEN